jgi:hypothetical protein
MTPYLIATALVCFTAGFSLASYSYRKICDDWQKTCDKWYAICAEWRDRYKAQSDAFNHILSQRNDLQNKLNELTK